MDQNVDEKKLKVLGFYITYVV